MVKRRSGHGPRTPKGRLKGFASKAQWRYFFAKGKKDPRFKKWAHETAHETQSKGGYKSLPWRKRGPSATTLRKGK